MNSKHGTFFLKIVIIVDIIFNNVTIFSKQFNSGSSKRKGARFRKQGDSTTDVNATIVEQNAEFLSSEEQKSVKNYLANAKNLGNREKDLLKRREEEKKENINKRKIEIKECVKRIEDISEVVVNFKFSKEDIDKIRSKMGELGEIIERRIHDAEEYIKDGYRSNETKNGDIEKLLNNIKKKNIQIFADYKRTFNSYIENINRILTPVSDFIGSIENFGDKAMLEKNINDCLSKNEFDGYKDILSNFNSYFSKLKNMTVKFNKFKMSDFYKSLDKAPLKLSEIDSQYAQFIDSFIRKTVKKKDELNNFFDSFKKDNDNANKDFDDLLKNQGLDGAKNEKDIKNAFAGRNKTIAEFCKDISEKSNNFYSKFEKNKKENDEKNKEFKIFNNLKDAILDSASKYRLSEIKGHFEDNENIKNKINEYIEKCKGYGKEMEEKIKKYEAIKKNKDELISKYSKDCQYDYNKESKKLVDFDETEKEADDVKKVLESVIKKKELLAKDNFVLSSAEQNELSNAINVSEGYIKDYLDKKNITAKKYKAEINTLEKNIKDDEIELKNNIAQYNAILAQKVEKRQQYLELIKNIYDEIKKKIDKIEYDDEIKNNIFDNLKGKFTNNFNNEFKNVTFGNSTEKYLQTENYDLLKKLKQLLKGDFVQDKPFTANFKLKNKEELNDFINEKQKEIEEIQKKQKKIIDDIKKITLEINKLEKNKEALNKTKEDYKNKCGNFEKVIKDNDSLFKEFKGDIGKKCEDLLKKCSDNNKSINNIKFNYDTIIKTKSKVDNKDQKIEDGGSVLNYDTYKIESYNANIYKDYTKDNNNLFDYYCSINSVKSINGTLDKNEIIQVQQSIIPLCNKLREKINNFIKAYTGIGTGEKGFIEIDKNKKYYEIHKEFLENREYVSDYSLYFLEYFDCKKDYEDIQKGIVQLYNVLLQYKSLLKVGNYEKINDKIIKNIKIANDLLSPYYKDLFENVPGGSIKIKVEIKKDGAGAFLEKIVDKLSEITFEKYFGKLCTQYNVDENNINTDKIKESIECLKKINNEYKKIDNSKKEDIEQNTKEIYKNIDDIKNHFDTFIGGSEIGKSLTEAEFNCYKKIDLLRGNKYLASDLKILNDKLSEIASELMFFKNKNALNNDVVDLSTINIEEKENLKKIYYVFKFTTYFDTIFDKEGGVFKDVIDKIKGKLMEIYSKEIIDQLEILKKSVEAGDANTGKPEGVLYKVFTQNADKNFLQEVQKTMADIGVVVEGEKTYRSKLLTNTNDLLKIFENYKQEFNNEFGSLNDINKIKEVDSLVNFKGVIQRVINLRDELYTILSKFNKLCKDDPDIYKVNDDFSNYTVKNKKLELKYSIIVPNNENDDRKKFIKYSITGLEADQNTNTALKVLFGSVNTILFNFYKDIIELNQQVKIIEEIKEDSTNEVLATLSKLKKFDKEFKFEENDFSDTNNLVDKYKDIFPTGQIETLKSEGFKKFLTKDTEISGENNKFYIHYLIRKEVAEILNDLYDKIILNVFCSNKFFNPDVFFDQKNFVDKKTGKYTYNKVFNFLTNYVYFFKEYFAFYEKFKGLLNDFGFIKEANNAIAGTDTKLSFFNILNQNIANINTLLKIHGFDSKGDTVEICNKNPNNNKKNIYTIKGILGKICNIVIEEIVKLNLGDVKVLNQKMLKAIYEGIQKDDIGDSIKFIEEFKKSINYAELSKDDNNKHKLYDNSNFEFTKLLDDAVKDLLDNIVCNEGSSVNNFVEHFGNLGSYTKYIVKDIKKEDFIYQVKRTICSELEEECNDKNNPNNSHEKKLYYFATEHKLYELLIDIFENIFTTLKIYLKGDDCREKKIAPYYIKFPINILGKVINNEPGYTNDMCYNELISYRENYENVFGIDTVRNEKIDQKDDEEITKNFYFDFYENLELIFNKNNLGNIIEKILKNLHFFKVVYDYNYTNESSLRNGTVDDFNQIVKESTVNANFSIYSQLVFFVPNTPAAKKKRINSILEFLTEKEVVFDNFDDDGYKEYLAEKNIITDEITKNKYKMEFIYEKMISMYEEYQKRSDELDPDDVEYVKNLKELQGKELQKINDLYLTVTIN